MSDLVTYLDRASPSGLDDLGGPWDNAVFDACKAFAHLDDTAKAEIRREMTRDRSWAIVSWAQGMATVAVRERSPERIIFGLVGLALHSRADFDERDALVVHPLLTRAADMIGEDSGALIDLAATYSDAVGRGWLLGLRDSTLTPAQMGFRERGSGGQFSFEHQGDDWDPEAELADYLEDSR